MNNNGIAALSDGAGKVTLSGFTFLMDQQPEEFEVCLLIKKTGYLSAGCWLTSSLYPDGRFLQGHSGFVEATDVLAWMPIEKTSTDLNRMCWNPDYRSIASFLDCFIVYAKNTDPTLIIEYSGGEEKVVLINMDVTTGELDGDSQDVQETLKAWYNDNKVKLIKDYYSGSYKVLPNWN